MDAQPHSEGTQEFITVYDGEITVLIDQEEPTIRKGDSIRFKSDKPHAYHNSGSKLERFNLVIFYLEK